MLGCDLAAMVFKKGINRIIGLNRNGGTNQEDTAGSNRTVAAGRHFPHTSQAE